MTPEDLPDARPPDPGTLHVWILDVTAPWYDALADTDLASEGERARAASFTRERLARSLLARRSALRCVLARYLGGAPGSVEVVTAPGGKPILLPRAGDASPPTLAFSVGHSGDLYGVAIGTASSVGFDLERRRPVPRAEAIARRWFADPEARALEALEGEEIELEFLRLWTAKEALAKRHGAGLRLMMRGDTAELDTRAAESEGRLAWLSPRPGYHAAVASTEAVERVTVVEPRHGSWIG